MWPVLVLATLSCISNDAVAWAATTAAAAGAGGAGATSSSTATAALICEMSLCMEFE